METGEEVYISVGLAIVQHAYSIVTQDGVRILLGVMAENSGAQMPYDKAAARIAAHAGVPVTDHGAVRVGGVLHAMLHDVPPWSTETMTPAERTRWHRRATLTIRIILLMVSLIAVTRACSRS